MRPHESCLPNLSLGPIMTKQQGFTEARRSWEALGEMSSRERLAGWKWLQLAFWMTAGRDRAGYPSCLC